jgi:hypothetical protein
MHKSSKDRDVDDAKILRADRQLIYSPEAFEHMVPEEEAANTFEGNVPRQSAPKPILNLKLDKNSWIISEHLPYQTQARTAGQGREDLLPAQWPQAPGQEGDRYQPKRSQRTNEENDQ